MVHVVTISARLGSHRLLTASIEASTMWADARCVMRHCYQLFLSSWANVVGTRYFPTRGRRDRYDERREAPHIGSRLAAQIER